MEKPKKEDITKTNLDITVHRKDKLSSDVRRSILTVNVQLWIKMSPKEQDDYIKQYVPENEELINYNPY